MTDRCSQYKLAASSKGDTIFDFFDTNPPIDEYSDYMYWDNKKTNWVVASNNIILGFNNETSNRQINTVSIGFDPGHLSQGTGAISIGYYAGYTTQSQNAIAFGKESGENYQHTNAIAIGPQSGQTDQSDNSIAIGFQAGQLNQHANSIAMGPQSGQTNQFANSIAMGPQSGQTNQNDNSIAIGFQAGQLNQGANSIAIGFQAGKNNQSANSIVLNASGNSLNPSTNGLFIKPAIRGPLGLTNVLCLNNTTNEVVYNSSSRRYKHDIKPFTKNTETIYQLEAKEFKYNIDNSSDIGFIAEEVAQIDPILSFDTDGIPEGIKWNSITTYLIVEMKKLNVRRNNLKKELLRLKISRSK